MKRYCDYAEIHIDPKKVPHVKGVEPDTYIRISTLFWHQSRQLIERAFKPYQLVPSIMADDRLPKSDDNFHEFYIAEARAKNG